MRDDQSKEGVRLLSEQRSSPDRVNAGLQRVPTHRGVRVCASVGVPRLRGVSECTAPDRLKAGLQHRSVFRGQRVGRDALESRVYAVYRYSGNARLCTRVGPTKAFWPIMTLSVTGGCGALGVLARGNRPAR